MTDIKTKDARSRNMSRIRAKDTTPEWVVRRLVHAAGFRYRLHVRSLFGSPDLVFPRLCKVIFVHGCFWHRHRCKNGQTMPKTRVAFWESKFEANVRRDAKVRRELRCEGWRVLVVWECETRKRDLVHLQSKLLQFLRA